MNKPMFWVGTALIVITAIFLLTLKEDIPLGFMGIIGIVFIWASQYRP